jgi:hypothetical protein
MSIVPRRRSEHAADVFVKLEPARRAIQRCSRFGLPLLTVMTGRGYHFTGRIPLHEPLVARLSAIAPLPAWLATHPARRPAWTTVSISETHGRAHAAIGILIEYLAHEVFRRAALYSRIPIVVNGTTVGPGSGGRECTSLDFSYAGDRSTSGTCVALALTDRVKTWRADKFTLSPVIALPMACGRAGSSRRRSESRRRRGHGRAGVQRSRSSRAGPSASFLRTALAARRFTGVSPRRPSRRHGGATPPIA